MQRGELPSQAELTMTVAVVDGLMPSPCIKAAMQLNFREAWLGIGHWR
jgi:hypothetical protein